MQFIQRSVFEIGLLVIVIRCALHVFHRQATVKDFVALLTYWVQLQQPLRALGDSYRGIHSMLAAAEHLVDLLKREPSTKDLPDAVTLEVARGEIKFEKVKFSYDSETAVLKQLTFCVPPGRTVAVVGESGGGKSTILTLLLRLYDVTGGSISIDGQDLRNYTISSLRDNISIVPQVCASLISLMSGTPTFQCFDHVQHSRRQVHCHR